MPIRYEIDEALGIIRETWDGDVSAAELGDYWRALLADAEVMRLRTTLVDFRRANPKFSGQELGQLIASIVDPALQGRDWKTAIVVEGPVQMGVSRQYSALADHYSRDAIFQDPDAALSWLLRQKS